MDTKAERVTCPYGCGAIFKTEFELGSHGIQNHPRRPILADYYSTKLGMQLGTQSPNISEARTNEDHDNDHPQNGICRHGDVQFCLDVILKEAREEDLLVKQLLYCMLSAYTKNPINLAVNSPPGSGKTHSIMKTVAIFPKSDVVLLAGMTDKALFHRQGVLVAQNDRGEYEPIEPRIGALQEEIDALEIELLGTGDKSRKVEIRKKKAILEKQKSEILSDAKKLIDLSNKILVFLDTPSVSLFAAMMPLLSHDAWEVEYAFVDASSAIRTKSNVLRGWPAVIFAQAIDSSQHPRWPEISRRFIVTNPKQSDAKVKAAIELTAEKYGLPDMLYQETVVSDDEKDKARALVEGLKDRMLRGSKNCKPGRNNVLIPFRKTIEKSLPSSEASDMTTANRFFSWLSLLPLVNYDQRPCLVIGDLMVPLATFEDLKESLSLTEYSDGLRPYVLEWFNDIFMPAYAQNNGPISIKSIVQWTLETKDKRVSREYVRKGYLEPLYYQGYLDREQNPEDKREYLFSPVKGKQGRIFDSYKISVRDPSLYPNTTNLIAAIHLVAPSGQILDATRGEKIAVVLSLEEVVTKYYSDPSACFDGPGQNDLSLVGP